VRLTTAFEVAVAMGALGCSLTSDLDQHRASRNALDAGAGGSADAGPETGAGSPDAGARSPCDGTRHFLCADFDEGDDVADAFTEPVVSSGASLLFDEAHVSPPRSLRATVPVTAAAVSQARLKRVLPASPRRLRASMRLRLCAPAAAPDFHEVFKLEENGGGGIKLVAKGTAGAGAVGYTLTGGASGNFPLDRPFPLGQWFHVALDVVLDKTAGQVRVVLDGDEAHPVLERTNVPTAGTAPSTAFYVGDWTNQSSNECATLVDDVVVDIE
jgi:hypothetical protein